MEINDIILDKKVLKHLKEIYGRNLLGLLVKPKSGPKRVYSKSAGRYVNLPDIDDDLMDFANELVDAGYHQQFAELLGARPNPKYREPKSDIESDVEFDKSMDEDIVELPPDELADENTSFADVVDVTEEDKAQKQKLAELEKEKEKLAAKAAELDEKEARKARKREEREKEENERLKKIAEESMARKEREKKDEEERAKAAEELKVEIDKEYSGLRKKVLDFIDDSYEYSYITHDGKLGNNNVVNGDPIQTDEDFENFMLNWYIRKTPDVIRQMQYKTFGKWRAITTGTGRGARRYTLKNFENNGDVRGMPQTKQDLIDAMDETLSKYGYFDGADSTYNPGNTGFHGRFYFSPSHAIEGDEKKKILGRYVDIKKPKHKAEILKKIDDDEFE